MHYFLLIYFNNKPRHVSSRLADHYQEDRLFINRNWCSRALCWLAVASSQSTQRMKSASFWFILYGKETCFCELNVALSKRRAIVNSWFKIFVIFMHLRLQTRESIVYGIATKLGTCSLPVTIKTSGCVSTKPKRIKTAGLEKVLLFFKF